MLPPETLFVIPRGSSNATNRDAEFKEAVFNRRLLVYVDEWHNKRTMEVRAYGATPGDRRVLIGFQIDADRGVAPEQLWKMVDDLERVFISQEVYQSADRTVPSQYAGQIIRFEAVAPDTALDMTKHPAEGY